MNKVEFMRRLNELLIDVPEEERTEALQYYEDYFADAGNSREEEIVTELGSPEALAKAIREEISGTKQVGYDKEGEYTEQGFRDAKYYDNLAYLDKQQAESKEEQTKSKEQWEQEQQWNQNQNNWNQNSWNQNQNNWDQNYGYPKKKKEKRNGSQILLIVFACIFILPIVIPLGIGLMMGMFGLLIGLFFAVLALGLSGIICIAAGIFAVGSGITKLFLFVPTGLVVIGIGLVAFGFGFLLLELTSLCMKGIKAGFQGIIKLIGNLFSRKRREYTEEYEN